MSEMFILVQIESFIAAFIWGVISIAIYDVLRVFTQGVTLCLRTCKNKKVISLVLSAVVDALIAPFAAGGLFLIALEINGGMLRWYIFAGFILGALICSLTIGSLIIKIGRKTGRAFVKIHMKIACLCKKSCADGENEV